MRVLLVIPTYLYKHRYPVFVAQSDFPAGFAYLAAVLKQAGNEVFGVNPNNYPGFSSAREMATAKIRAAIWEYSPDLIGIGGLCTDFAFLKDMLTEVRKISPHTPVVMGGGIINHDARFVFQELRPDFCIVGEAEETIVQLARMIQTGDGNFDQIKNLGFWNQNQVVFTSETDCFPDLDTLPFPDYTPFDIDTSLKYSIASRYLFRYTRPFPRHMTLVAARSCPFNCTFCVHKHRSRYRARSIGNIMEEIRFLYDRYQFNNLIILDELFAANKSRLEEFCHTLIEYRSKEKLDFDWLFQTHANARLDTKALKLARVAGCYYFSYGMESASPTVLASMNKKIRPAQLQEAIEISQQVPIGFGENFIFGDIAETVDTVNETLNFYERYCLNAHVFITTVEPYPGSALFDHCIQVGLIPDKSKYYETIGQIRYNMTALPAGVWNQCLQHLGNLERLPYIIQSAAIKIQRESEEIPTSDPQHPQPVYGVTSICPHCQEEVFHRELLNREEAVAGKASFVTGCPKCQKRYRVMISGAVFQRAVEDYQASAVHAAFVDYTAGQQPGTMAGSGKKKESFPEVAMQNRKAKQKILLVLLEFSTWTEARHWNYISNFAYELGFQGNNMETLVLPVTGRLKASSPTSWLSRRKELLAGKNFDQAWIWLVHNEFTPDFMDWFSGIAPVRVGFVCEGLEYPPDVYAEAPVLREYKSHVLQQIRGTHLTHVLTGDEKDAEYINQQGIAKSFVAIGAVPQKFIFDQYTQPAHSEALFIGNLYSQYRQRLLKFPGMQGLLAHPPAPEESTSMPQCFDKVQQSMADYLQSGQPVDENLLNKYVDNLRKIHALSFVLMHKEIQEYSSYINPPSYFQAYTDRIYAGMAAGRPVISWRISHRPLMEALFEPGKEILLYDKDDPQQLADHIQRVQRDPAFARSIVDRARAKMLRYHTSEERIRQYLHWIESGEEPDMGGAELAVTPLEEVATLPARPDSMPNITSKESAMYTPSKTEQDYYAKIFIDTPITNTPFPNAEERARWVKISSFFEALYEGFNGMGNEGLRILDMGCGRGWTTNLASAFGTVEGVDPVARVVEQARRHFPWIKFTVGTTRTILDEPGFKPYDVVLTTEVIEHIPKEQHAQFVCEMYQLLKPEGHVIMTTPRGEVLDRWIEIVGKPNQPVEDWRSEQEIFELFTSQGFRSIGVKRAYVEIPSFVYVLCPTPQEIESRRLAGIHQIWCFEKTSSYWEKGQTSLGTISLLPEKLSSAPAVDPDRLMDEAMQYAQLADQSFQQGDLQAAKDYLRKALDLVPENPQLIIAYGNTLLNIRDAEGARSQFVKATVLAPDYLPGFVSLSAVLLLLGRHSEAEKSLQRARALDAQNPDVLKMLGRLSLGYGRFEEAARFFSEVFIRQPGDKEAVASLAQYYLNRSNTGGNPIG